MAGLVQGLKKGNQTLTRKVEILENQITLLKKENSDLRIENFNLNHSISRISEQKQSHESEIITHFAGLFGNILKSIDLDE